ELQDTAARVFGRPMAISAQAVSPETHRVAVLTGPANVSIPSNLYLFDVGPGPAGKIASTWVGAATLSSTAQTGIGLRVALHGNFVYASTTFKGVQVVDVGQAVQQFKPRGGNTSPMRIPFNTDGIGWGQEYVVSTIPVSLNTGPRTGKPAFLSDLKVGDFI